MPHLPCSNNANQQLESLSKPYAHKNAALYTTSLVFNTISIIMWITILTIGAKDKKVAVITGSVILICISIFFYFVSCSSFETWLKLRYTLRILLIVSAILQGIVLIAFIILCIAARRFMGIDKDTLHLFAIMGCLDILVSYGILVGILLPLIKLYKEPEIDITTTIRSIITTEK